MSGSTLVAAPDRGVAVVWSEDIGARILDLYAAGEPLYRIAAREGFPAVQTMYEWRERHPEWATALARARMARAERTAEDGLSIIDEPLSVDGEGRTNSADATRNNNRANYRRWLAGCLDRATYGDALKVDGKLEVAALVAFVPLGASAAQRIEMEKDAGVVGGAMPKPPTT